MDDITDGKLRTTSVAVSVNGLSVQLRSKVWQVVDRQNWSEPRVSVNGHINPYGGYSYISDIHVHNIKQQEIWLCDDQGREFPLRLAGTRSRVRPGHLLTLFSAEVGDQAWLVGMLNQSTNRQERLLQGWEAFLGQIGALRTPAWNRLTTRARVLLLAGLATVSWIAAAVILWGLVNVQVLPPAQSEDLRDNQRALHAKILALPLGAATRALEREAESIQGEIDRLPIQERNQALLAVNGIGGSLLLLGSSLLIMQSTRYRKQLAKAENVLEDGLVRLQAGVIRSVT